MRQIYSILPHNSPAIYIFLRDTDEFHAQYRADFDDEYVYDTIAAYEKNYIERYDRAPDTTGLYELVSVYFSQLKQLYESAYTTAELLDFFETRFGFAHKLSKHRERGTDRDIINTVIRDGRALYDSERHLRQGGDYLGFVAKLTDRFNKYVENHKPERLYATNREAIDSAFVSYFAKYIRIEGATDAVVRAVFPNEHDNNELISLIEGRGRALWAERPEGRGIFTLPQIAKKVEGMPPLRKLVGGLLVEEDFAIFFGDTGLGKSTFAVQIAQAIASGSSVSNELTNESASPKRVLYYHLELTMRDLNRFYPDNSALKDVHFVCADGSSTDNFAKKLEDNVRKDGYNFIIIDNYSKLSSNLKDPQIANEISNALKDIRDKYAVTILVINHTTKRYLDKPIHIDECKGAKDLLNFATSVFAINKNEQGQLYLKQLKSRFMAEEFGSQNVLQIERKTEPFLSFEVIKTCKESELFGGSSDSAGDSKPSKSRAASKRDTKKSKARELHLSGMLPKEIADIMNIGERTVYRYINEELDFDDETQDEE